MPSFNQEIQRHIESLPSLSHAEILASILQSQDPIQDLNSSSEKIPFFLSTEYSTELKKQTQNIETRENAMTELVYHCLPQLRTILMEHNNLGVEKEELFSFGMQSLINCIAEWDPSKITEESPTNGELRQTVLKRGRRMVREFIAKHYNLSPSRFELVPIYFQVKKEFEENSGKKASLADWFQINELIQNYASRMPTAEQNEFEKMRFIKNTLSSDEQPSPAIDALKLIHTQFSSEEIMQTENDLQADLSNVNDTSLKEALLNASSDLPVKIQKIIQLYYGINGDETHTLQEIAKNMGCSTQNVHQLLEKGIRMLRHPLRTKYTKQFYNR